MSPVHAWLGAAGAEVAVQQIRHYRQFVPAIGGHHAEAPLAAGANAVLLHQPLHPLFAHADDSRLRNSRQMRGHP